MSFENQPQQQEDIQVESALRHFRESVRGWSDTEFTKARTITPRSRVTRFWQSPILSWGAAAVLAVSAITVPVEVRHQRQVAAQQQAAAETQRQLAAQTAQAAEQQQVAAMTDEELLSHVDTDIAQATPDAMEPLASLMSDAIH